MVCTRCKKYEDIIFFFFFNICQDVVELFYNMDKNENKIKVRKCRGVQEAEDEGSGSFTGSGRQNAQE